MDDTWVVVVVVAVVVVVVVVVVTVLVVVVVVVVVVVLPIRQRICERKRTHERKSPTHVRETLRPQTTSGKLSGRRRTLGTWISHG